ncbi:hypothetical protein [Marinobacter sp.]|uniref:hypothetical protein n=1 Tax=Marinobacter sp. TaxID=50741 RepID=UPI003A925849
MTANILKFAPRARQGVDGAMTPEQRKMISRASFALNAHNKPVQYGAFNQLIAVDAKGKRTHTAGRFIDDLRQIRVGNLSTELEFRCEALSLVCYVTHAVEVDGDLAGSKFQVEVYEYDSLGHIGRHYCNTESEARAILQIVLKSALDRALDRYDMSCVLRDEIRLTNSAGLTLCLPESA